MPANPGSPHASQRVPYVVRSKDGKVFDNSGRVADKKSPESHIPQDEFIFRP